jgi:hypothetical protein
MRALLEKLSSYIPGYTGYADRETRRQTDHALRQAVSQRIADRKQPINRLIAEAARTMRFEALEPLENVRRRLDRLADLVRLSPAGYTGLFDAREVGSEELDRLTAHDGGVRDAVEELSALIDALSLSDTESMVRVERGLSALEDSVRRRDDLLRGVD